MSNTIESKVIGLLTQDKTFPDWWNSQEIAIPLFNDQKFPVTFTNFMPDDDEAFIAEADIVLSNFLSFKAEDKLVFSKAINDFRFDTTLGLDDDEIPEAVRDIKESNEIWQFVHPSGIYVTRNPCDDKEVYVQVTCDCDWEFEHGLQLVFRQGKTLTKVSDQGDDLS